MAEIPLDEILVQQREHLFESDNVGDPTASEIFEAPSA